jgi:AraC family transcriptional regulator
MGRTVADGPILEFHNDEFDPDTGLGGVRIHIPLEPSK